ncbi:hypothetical protein V1509DRAFT_619254 [Lipomyces kononenkoae]
MLQHLESQTLLFIVIRSGSGTALGVRCLRPNEITSAELPVSIDKLRIWEGNHEGLSYRLKLRCCSNHNAPGVPRCRIISYVRPPVISCSALCCAAHVTTLNKVECAVVLT